MKPAVDLAPARVGELLAPDVVRHFGAATIELSLIHI